MTERKSSLVDRASKFRPQSSKGWVGRLEKNNPKLLKEIIHLAERWGNGELDDKFPTITELARWVKEESPTIRVGERMVRDFMQRKANESSKVRK